MNAIAPLLSQTLAQSFGNDAGAKYILLGAVVLIVLYVVFRPFLQKKKTDPLARPMQASRLSQQRGAERQMETLLVELNEMARQMSAQLDTRAAKLEAIIKDADERIAELRDLIEIARSDAARPPAARGLAPDESHSDPDFNPRSTQTRPPRYPPRNDPPIVDVDPTHARVHALADEGKTVGEIATALARPSGEVELILALRPKAAR